MLTRSLVISFVLVACGSETPEQKTAAKPVQARTPSGDPWKNPSPAPAPTPAPAPVDRRNDPAFALTQDAAGRYVGTVRDACLPTAHLADVFGYKLDGTKLDVTLFDGGCPTWAGYSVVTGTGSPLPFYVCVEPEHDKCEAAGRAQWVFDISTQLAKNGATAVTHAVPAGVH